MFDWQKEDEHWAEDAPVIEETKETAVARRPRWWLLGVLVGLLLLAGWLVNRRVQQQVAAVTASIEGDVLSSHRLWQQSAVDRDADLYKWLLSARSKRWADRQQTLLAEGLVLARPQMPMTHTTAVAPQITLNDELREAVLRFRQDYAVETGWGITQTLALTQTAVYRRGLERWLYAPPLDDFWGEWQNETRQRITVAYPARDAEWVEPLVDQWDELLQRLCDEIADMNCAPGWRLNVRLETDPDLFLAATQPEWLHDNPAQLRLPTPTLRGVPADETAVALWQSLYAREIVTAAVVDLVNYECCRRQAMFDALLQQQLATLGIGEYALTTTDYARLAINGPSIAGLDEVWRGDVAERPFLEKQLFALAEYALQVPGEAGSVATMQRGLSGDYGSLRHWVSDTVLPSFSFREIETGLWDYLYARSPGGQLAEPPVPLPDAVLQVGCRVPSDQQVQAHELDPRNGRWQMRMAADLEANWNRELRVMGKDLFLVQQYQSGSFPRGVQQVYRGDTLIATFEPPENEAEQQYFGFVDPTGRYVMDSLWNLNDNSSRYRIYDLDSCLSGRCDTKDVPNWLYWSPDGRYTLLLGETAGERILDPDVDTVSTFPTYLGDAVGDPIRLVADKTVWSFWIDETRFGYVQSVVVEGISQQSVWIMSLHDEAPALLLTEADLLMQIPVEQRREELYFWVVDFDNASGGFLVVARDGTSSAATTHWFWLTLNEAKTAVATISWVYAERGTPNPFVRLAPNGRWLYQTDYQNPESLEITMTNVVNGRRLNIVTDTFSQAWSPDGNWLAYVQNGLLMLLNPDNHYLRFFPLPTGSCTSIFWAER